MGKKKQAPAVQQRDPYQIGFDGTVDELNQVNQAAKQDMESKKAAYDAQSEKTDDGSHMFGYRKYMRLRDAYRDAETASYSIHHELREGAFQAFLEGRHENLQEIIAHPGQFRNDSWERPEEFVSRTIIALIEQKPDPAVARLAVEKVEEGEKANVLKRALNRLIQSQDNNLEAKADILLKAGAPADSETLTTLIHSNKPFYIEKTVALLLDNGIKADGSTLAVLIDNEASQSLLDLVLKDGVTYDDALTAMRNEPDNYSTGAAGKLEFILYKKETQATISQLKAAITQITGQPAEEAPAHTILAPEKKEPAEHVLSATAETIQLGPVENEPVQQAPLEAESAQLTPPEDEPAEPVAAEKEEIPATSYPTIDPLRRRFRALSRSSAEQPVEQPAQHTAPADEETSQPAPAASSTLPVNPRRPRFRTIR